MGSSLMGVAHEMDAFQNVFNRHPKPQTRFDSANISVQYHSPHASCYFALDPSMILAQRKVGETGFKDSLAT
jgi:hypothetical protein